MMFIATAVPAGRSHVVVFADALHHFVR